MIADDQGVEEEIYEVETAKKPPAWYGHEAETYEVVGPIAFLIGLTEKEFNLTFACQQERFSNLMKDKSARTVRNLCILRTEIMKHYRDLSYKMRHELKNLNSCPEYITQEALRQLEVDGVPLFKTNYTPKKYLMDINRLLCENIGKCQRLIPDWVNWEYIKALFIVPKGTTEKGVDKMMDQYFAKKSDFPYFKYLNWNFRFDGNILLNDKKFVQLLYNGNGSTFYDLSKVTDAKTETKQIVYNFLEKSQKTCIIVDCENVDPYKMYATLNNLDQEELLSKVTKIILIDDVNTTSAWEILDQFTEIPVEHVMTERVHQNKSLVDITLTAAVCKEFYADNTDSFILSSSDSDFWGLIRSLPNAGFLVLVESENMSSVNRNEMLKTGTPFCYMDDFCTGNSYAIKTATVLKEIKKTLAPISFNLNDVFKEARFAARAEMTKAEQEQFYNRHLKKARLQIGNNGDATIVLGE